MQRPNGVVKRIAISLGGGFVPGLSALVCAVAAAATARGWQVVGLRDGFDGLVFPERYADGATVVELSQGAAEADGSLLGTGARTDPFRVQRENADGFVEEVDESTQLLDRLRALRIDALCGVVGGSAVAGAYALSVLWRLSRRGLPCVGIPKSVENDLAATDRPFGYASVRDAAIAWLRGVRIAARDQGRVALVELPGYLSGRLALDAGLAADADVILTPERAYVPGRVAQWLDAHPHSALVVVAEGAHTVEEAAPSDDGPVLDRAVLYRAGRVAQQVCENVQRHCSRDVVPVVLNQLVRTGPVSPADTALGQAYAAAAVDALANGLAAHLLAARGGSMHTVPMAEAVNRISVVGDDSTLVAAARARPVCLGDAR